MCLLVAKGARGKMTHPPNILSEPGAILLNHCCPKLTSIPLVNTACCDMFTNTRAGVCMPVDVHALMRGHTPAVSVN